MIKNENKNRKQYYGTEDKNNRLEKMKRKKFFNIFNKMTVEK